MGELIDLAQRRDAAQRRTRRREPVRAQLFFDLACPFTYLAAERVERAFAHVTWTAASSETLQRRCLADDAGDASSACAPRPSSAPRRCGCRSCGPRASRRRCRRRCAPRRSRPSRGAAARSCSRPAGSRSAAASTSTTPRSSPRPRPPPASGSTSACAPRATRAATARWRRRAAACWPRARTGCRRCGSGASLFWGEQRVGAAAASVRQATPGARARAV